MPLGSNSFFDVSCFFLSEVISAKFRCKKNQPFCPDAGFFMAEILHLKKI